MNDNKILNHFCVVSSENNFLLCEHQEKKKQIVVVIISSILVTKYVSLEMDANFFYRCWEVGSNIILTNIPE